MFCSKCGSPLTPESSVCSMCGNNVNDLNNNPQPNVPKREVPQSVPLESLVTINEQILQETSINEPVMPQQMSSSIENHPEKTNSLEISTNDNFNSSPEPNKQNNNVPKIILALLVLVIIVIVGFNVKSRFSKSNVDGTDENQKIPVTENKDKTTTQISSSKTTKKQGSFEPLPPVTNTIPNTTNKANGDSYSIYEGFKMFVPNSFTTMEQSGSLIYMSNANRQLLTVQVLIFPYEETDIALENEISSMQQYGFVATSSKHKSTYNGIRYSLFKGTLNGNSVSIGCAEFVSGYSISFAFRTDLASENSYFNILSQIITKSVKITEENNKNTTDNKLNTLGNNLAKMIIK